MAMHNIASKRCEDQVLSFEEYMARGADAIFVLAFEDAVRGLAPSRAQFTKKGLNGAYCVSGSVPAALLWKKMLRFYSYRKYRLVTSDFDARKLVFTRAGMTLSIYIEERFWVSPLELLVVAIVF